MGETLGAAAQKRAVDPTVKAYSAASFSLCVRSPLDGSLARRLLSLSERKFGGRRIRDEYPARRTSAHFVDQLLSLWWQRDPVSLDRWTVAAPFRSAGLRAQAAIRLVVDGPLQDSDDLSPGHDLEKPDARLNSAKTSPFVANPYTLGQSCSILLLNVL